MTKLSVKEYAYLKGISESTVKNRIRENKLEAIQENGKYFIIVKETRRVIPKEEQIVRSKLKDFKAKYKEFQKSKATEIELLKKLNPDDKEWYIKKLESENEELKETIKELHQSEKEQLGKIIGQYQLMLPRTK